MFFKTPGNGLSPKGCKLTKKHTIPSSGKTEINNPKHQRIMTTVARNIQPKSNPYKRTVNLSNETFTLKRFKLLYKN